MLRPLIDGILRKAARHTRSKPFAMRNTAPLVTFTFDDVPDSAAINGGGILEERDVRGTFYIAAGILGAQDEHWQVLDRGQVRTLYERGHEIGCHTFSHVAVERLDAATMDEECRRNHEALADICPGIAVTNFCYPFGKVSLPRKLQLGSRYDSCRGIYQGINAGAIDLALLRAIDLYDRTLSPAKLEQAIRQTRERNGWLIFCTHDVADNPSWIGASPRLLRETVALVQASGLQCVTIRDGLTAIGYSAADRMPPPASHAYRAAAVL